MKLIYDAVISDASIFPTTFPKNDAVTPVIFTCSGNLPLFNVPVVIFAASTYDAVDIVPNTDAVIPVKLIWSNNATDALLDPSNVNVAMLLPWLNTPLVDNPWLEVIAFVAHDEVPCKSPITFPKNDAVTPVTFICSGNLSLFNVPVVILAASTYDALETNPNKLAVMPFPYIWSKLI